VHGSEVLPRLLAIQDGDVLIALRSTGVHSNGLSLVRKCMEMSGLGWNDPPPFDSPYSTLADALLVPTRIYVKELQPVLRRRLVKSMAHITGGGLLGNIPRALPSHLRAVLNASASHWSLPPVFRWLQTTARLSQRELLRTFNCGIGMVLVVDRAAVPEVMALLEVSPSAPFILGSVRPRPPFYDMPVPAGDMQAEAAQVTIVGKLA
jgi:phosphoribosylamine--glycine ligase/phosphoribosylformylglycinamidine cyclo-ligase